MCMTSWIPRVTGRSSRKAQLDAPTDSRMVNGQSQRGESFGIPRPLPKIFLERST